MNFKKQIVLVILVQAPDLFAILIRTREVVSLIKFRGDEEGITTAVGFSISFHSLFLHTPNRNELVLPERRTPSVGTLMDAKDLGQYFLNLLTLAPTEEGGARVKIS